MKELARVGEVNKIFSLKDLDASKHEQALGLRRLCLDKMAEITIQSAHQKQYEAEALKDLRKAKEADESTRPEDADWFRAKAETLRANAAHSRERVKQAGLELDFIINRGIQ